MRSAPLGPRADRLGLEHPLGAGEHPVAGQERADEERAAAAGRHRRRHVQRPQPHGHERGDGEHHAVAPPEQQRDDRDQHEQVRPRQHRRRQQQAGERVAAAGQGEHRRGQPQRAERFREQVAGHRDQRRIGGHEQRRDQPGPRAAERRGEREHEPDHRRARQPLHPVGRGDVAHPPADDVPVELRGGREGHRGARRPVQALAPVAPAVGQPDRDTDVPLLVARLPRVRVDRRPRPQRAAQCDHRDRHPDPAPRTPRQRPAASPPRDTPPWWEWG